MLSDPRNNLFAPCWANLFRVFLLNSFMSGAPLQAGEPGIGYARKLATGDITSDPRFRYIDRISGAERPVTTVSTIAAYLGAYADLPADQPGLALEFSFTGDEVRIIHGVQPHAQDAAFSVEIDGKLAQTFSHYGEEPAFGITRKVTTTFGKHMCRIYNNSVRQRLHLEAVQHNRRILVRNQGIIGTTAQHWQPEGRFLYSVDAADQFVLVMLGANDREIVPGTVNHPARLRRNLLTIVDSLLPRHEVILLTPPRAALDYPMEGYAHDMGDAAAQVRHVARERNLPLVDIFATTAAHAESRRLMDGLHLSDYGHDLVFKTICSSAGLATVSCAAPTQLNVAYSSTALPPAWEWQWRQVLIADETGSGMPVYSDGANWRCFVNKSVVA